MMLSTVNPSIVLDDSPTYSVSSRQVLQPELPQTFLSTAVGNARKEHSALLPRAGAP